MKNESFVQVMNNDLQKDFHKEVKNIHNDIFVNEKARKNFSALSAIFNELKEDSNVEDQHHKNENPEVEQQDVKKSAGDHQDQPKQMVAGIKTKYMSIVPKWILKSMKLKAKEILISRTAKKSSNMIVQEIMELLKDIETEET